MRILMVMFLIMQISGVASAEINFSMGTPDKINQQTWISSDKNISFNYPSNWGPEKARDNGVQLYKAGKGWFELNLIDLPAGENLEGFSKHLIEKSKSGGWDISFENDLGRESIGDKTAWVHKYRHKKKARTYYGYHFISKGNVGIRVLMVKISRQGGDTMMDMLSSLRYPQVEKPATLLSVKQQMTAGETTVVNKTKKIDTAFGTYQKNGSVRGRVQLKDNKDKSAYPCYLKFQPVKQVKGSGRSRKREDYEAIGGPVLTATDEKGRYHADLEEGTYLLDVYNADGQNWPLLKGDIFHRSRAKKVHNCKIDNRR